MNKIPENYYPGDPNDISVGKRDYAIAKRDAEEFIRQLGQDGLSVSIARCFAFVGHWLPLDQHFAIGNFLRDGLSGRPIQVNARHQVYRSYMYADDLVEWLMTIACHSNPDCPVYNVGSDHAVLMGELAEMIAGEFGLNANIPPICEDIVDRYVPSIDKANHSLGLNLRYDLLASIRNTIASLKREE
jgi:dTDP-glucose 4,6-dehydratase